MEPLDQVIDGLSWACLLAGSFFYVVGMIGLNRMPDLFSRMHAISVSETLGVGLLILGMILQAGFTLVSVKLVFIFLVIVATAPVVTHALARAAFHDGAKPLLTDAEGQLRETDCVTIYPELGERFEEPISSETVEVTGIPVGISEEAKPSN